MTEFFEHPWINPDTIEKREYQDKVLTTALKGNTLCVLPTGTGKTPIAALVAAKRLEKDMHSKILFMAPTRPLVNQHRKSFEKFLKIGPDELIVVMGTIRPKDRYELYKKADVVFATPQCIRNDLKKGFLKLNDFHLLIVDESHRSIGNYAYTYVAKKYIEQAKDPLILALTASPGSTRSKIFEIKKNLFIDYVEIKSKTDGDVKPYIQIVKKEYITVELSPALKLIKKQLEDLKNGRIEKLMKWGVIHSKRTTKSQIIKLQNNLSKKKSGFSFMAMSVLAEILKTDHALELLETQSLDILKNYFDKLLTEGKAGGTKAAKRLIEDEQFKNIMRLTFKSIYEKEEHPKITKLKEVIKREFKENKDARIIIFAQFRDTIDKINEMLNAVDGVKSVEFIGQAKKKGKGLSQKEQIDILKDFRAGVYNTLCSSSVGEEGLDIQETDIVVFYDNVSSAVRRIQRSGRTARTKPGKIIALITKGTRDEAYYWSAYNKEKGMKKLLYGMQKKQKDLGDYEAESS